MEYPLISIVVAVYNTKAYLMRCVESVLRQTYKNWELILVDDGSTDGSAAMCDTYAKQDCRIRVIHQENKGLSAARNMGMAIKTGEYLTFLDSDDCLADCALTRMLEVMQKTGADIVECDYRRFSEDAQLSAIMMEVDATNSLLYETYTSETFLEQIISDSTFHQMACAKLYRSEVLTLPFPEGKYHEDEYWTYRMVDKADIIAILRQPLYLYFVRLGSITQVRYSVRRLDGLFALKERYEYLSLCRPTLHVLLAKSYFEACMYHYQMLLVHKEVDSNGEWRAMILREMKKLPYKTWKKTLPLKQRIWQIAFRFMPALTGKIRNLFKIGW